MMPEPIEAIERSTMRRVYWRLIPLLFFAMFFNYLDRINIGFAGLRMNHDLGFSPGVFGFAGSIFFLGYMLLGIPSNLALSKFGARHWIPVILITWGAIAILTGFVWNSHSFYAVRLCLGIAEAGFLPGLALYSTFWRDRRLHHRRAVLCRGRRPALDGADDLLRPRLRPAWLAMDVYLRGRADHSARAQLPRAADQPPRSGRLVAAGTARLARDHAGTRAPGG
jgi:hypothetical protein